VVPELSSGALRLKKTLLLPVILCGGETPSFITTKNTLRVFHNKVLRTILGSRREDLKAARENCIVAKWNYCQILLG
jgi:hypothetical protein